MSDDRTIVDYTIAIVSIIIGVVMIITCAIPAIADSVTNDETVNFTNAGVKSLKLNKISPGENVTATFTNTGDRFGYSVTAQGSGGGGSMIQFDTMCLFATDTFIAYITGTNTVAYMYLDNDGLHTDEIACAFKVTLTSDTMTLTVSDVDTEIRYPQSYVYYPVSNGTYGSFTTVPLNKTEDDPVIAATYESGTGYFNRYCTETGVESYIDATNNEITSVEWGEPHISDRISAAIYVAPISGTYVIPGTAYSPVIFIIPVLLVAGLLLMTVSWFVYKKD